MVNHGFLTNSCYTVTLLANSMPKVGLSRLCLFSLVLIFHRFQVIYTDALKSNASNACKCRTILDTALVQGQGIL
jgi:hypothetical protein